MDAAGRVAYTGNQKGGILVFVAIFIAVFIAMAALVIDMGYMYVTKGQLQTASDAAALAGIQQIKENANPFDTAQTNARLLAYTTAGKNQAAAKAVVLANSGANGEPMPSDNDITVGFWHFSSHTYTSPPPTGMPANAMKVRARRSQDSPAGAVNTFLAKIMGKSSMDAVSDRDFNCPKCGRKLR